MEIKSRVPGVVETINFKVGDEVKKGDVVLTLEAMKMVQKVLAPVDGELTEINVEAEDHVKAGQVLAVIE